MNILRGYASKLEFSQQVVHFETPYIELRGRYWSDEDSIVSRSEFFSKDLHCFAERILYFRCIPHFQLAELTPLEAIDASNSLRPLMFRSGCSAVRNKWGAISYERSQSGDLLIGATQLFRNREIWGVDPTCADCELEPDQNNEAKRFVPTEALQRDYPPAIESMRKLAAKLGYGDKYTIEMGLSGAKGLHLAINKRHLYSLPGPFFGNEVFVRKTIPAEYPTMQIMNDFWGKLFSEVGRNVPDELIWKPSDA